MKICKKITGWTDYPFVELGDDPYEKAPIRHVEVIGYDGDKYVKVKLIGEDGPVVLVLKRAYLYRKAGRLGKVDVINGDKLCRAFGHDTIGLWASRRGLKIKRDRRGFITYVSND